MSKYTPRELRDMARIVIQASGNSPAQYDDFLFQVSVRAGVSQTFVMQKLLDYATQEIDE